MKKNMEKTLLVQTDQLKRGSKELVDLQSVQSDLEGEAKDQKEELEKLDARMAGLFQTMGMNRDDEKIQQSPISDDISLTDSEIANIEYHLPKFEKVPIVEVPNWQEYQKNIEVYIQKYQLDLSRDPMMQMLTSQQIQEIEQKFHREFGDARWNKWDYVAVGIAGLVGYLVDVLLVRMPAGAAKKYVPTDQQSPVGKWINQMMDSHLNPENNKMIQRLEDWAKTPYDAVRIMDFQNIVGESGRIKINANLHRLKTPGHDPILQLIFGVLDCFNGTMTVFNQKGNLVVLDNPNFQGVNLFTSIIKTLSHFLTDVGTPRGVVPPFFSLTQAITANTPFELNDRGTIRKMGLNELAERMYVFGGYNFNHFLTMSLTPFCVELIIRAYHWLTKPVSNVDFKKDFKLSSMLTVAHSLTMSGNVIKMWMNGWNPLAFNYAEMLMLVKSFYSLYKSKLERDRKIDETLLKNWINIYQGSC